MSGSYVVLRPGERLPAREAATLLVELLGGPVPDLAGRIRYGGGWIARGVSRETAAEVRRILLDLGHETLEFHDDETITPAVVHRVRSVRQEADTLELELARETEEIRLSDLALIDFMVVGEAVEVENQDPILRWAGPVLPSQPFAAQRAVIQEYDSSHLTPLIPLGVIEPVEFLLVERGTLFPRHTEGIGGSLENFLTFFQGLVEHVPPRHFMPEARRFWESARIEDILIRGKIEREARLSWLSEILARELWEDFR